MRSRDFHMSLLPRLVQASERSTAPSHAPTLREINLRYAIPPTLLTQSIAHNYPPGYTLTLILPLPLHSIISHLRMSHPLLQRRTSTTLRHRSPGNMISHPKLHQHRAVSFQFLNRYCEAEIVKEEELKFEVVEFREWKTSDLDLLANFHKQGVGTG